MHHDGKEVKVFKGIRYAKPPTGDLRFKRPQAMERQGDGRTVDALRWGAACIQNKPSKADLYMTQFIKETSEDCLFLNVWTPLKNLKPIAQEGGQFGSWDNPNSHLLPVIVFIHGGALLLGTASTGFYDGTHLACQGDVVVVTLNYRLGAFGFLYDETEDAPGNMGLQDQLMALQWVKSCIRFFGGNPDQVTLYGQSAGAVAIGSLMVSPLANGLFNRVILSSGAPLTDPLMKNASFAKQITIENAKKYGCRSNQIGVGSTRGIVSCLRRLSADQLSTFYPPGELPPEVGIVYDTPLPHQVMPMKPTTAFERGAFRQNLDVLFGVVEDEGSLLVEGMLGQMPAFDVKNPSYLGERKAKFFLAQLLRQLELEDKSVDRVVKFYLDGVGENNDDKLRHLISKALGDYLITCPTILFAEKYAIANARANGGERVHVYSYKYTYSTDLPGYCMGWMGVCHGMDLFYAFGMPLDGRNGKIYIDNIALNMSISRADVQFTQNIIDTYSDFAMDGCVEIFNTTSFQYLLN